MELKEGKITLRELSQWFGLSPDSISKAKPNVREKKFKLLKTFADYHFEGKRIIIDKVKIPEYNKAYEIIEREAPKTWGKLTNESNQLTPAGKKRIDTCTRVGLDIYYNNPDLKAQIQKDTSKTYVGIWKRKNYGRNHIKDDKGELGYCKSVYMNKEGDDLLDVNSLKILEECAQEAYAPFGIQVAQLDDDYRANEITKEERDQAVGNINTTSMYHYYCALVIEKLGYMPDKRTQLIDTNDFSKE